MDATSRPASARIHRSQCRRCRLPKMASVTVETQHEDMIVRSPACESNCIHVPPGRLSSFSVFAQHDSQFDYYGSKLATASSDKTIRIFSVLNGQQQATPLAILTGCALTRSPLPPISAPTDRQTARPTDATPCARWLPPDWLERGWGSKEAGKR